MTAQIKTLENNDMQHNMVSSTIWNEEAAEHQDVLKKTQDLLQPQFDATLTACVDAIKQGRKILFFGNGGSASDAQHLATELVVRFKKDRPAMAAIALTTDTSALTAIGNDFGFEKLFSRQIEALGNQGDVAIAFSTSGNSPNILAAIDACRQKGVKVIGMTGETGGKMAQECDVLVNIPSKTTARIQEMHIYIGHMLCSGIEKLMGYAE